MDTGTVSLAGDIKRIVSFTTGNLYIKNGSDPTFPTMQLSLT